eukprot:TRINITY_DN27720_c0_g1_i1.p1 TRINITY_DN27720_c0_g1~~TRINITY_DN27720_c0_g1_i1.p1  ORF type:complete len:107 (-),score=15.56 TRINITY_DN27720_c0_g1_i1:155-475(-)
MSSTSRSPAPMRDQDDYSGLVQGKFHPRVYEELGMVKQTKRWGWLAQLVSDWACTMVMGSITTVTLFRALRSPKHGGMKTSRKMFRHRTLYQALTILAIIVDVSRQ